MALVKSNPERTWHPKNQIQRPQVHTDYLGLILSSVTLSVVIYCMNYIVVRIAWVYWLESNLGAYGRAWWWRPCLLCASRVQCQATIIFDSLNIADLNLRMFGCVSVHVTSHDLLRLLCNPSQIYCSLILSSLILNTNMYNTMRHQWAYHISQVSLFSPYEALWHSTQYCTGDF